MHLTSSSGESTVAMRKLQQLRQGGGRHIKGERDEAAASSNWPLFSHLLPEIAFAGHSNSGKVSN